MVCYAFFFCIYVSLFLFVFFFFFFFNDTATTEIYTLSLHYALPISDIRIDNTLPAGGSYARGTAIGADSVLVAGGHLILVTTAPLAPGATRTLHYAVALASASGTMVEVRAIASARAGALQPVSPQAAAWVQVRRAWPMETRAAIGKV